MSYFYLASSLPLLTLGDSPPFTIEEFRTSAATMLSEDDLREFDLVVHGRAAEGASDFAEAWHNADVQIRNAVARTRAKERSIDARSYLHEHSGYDVALEKRITDAYAKANPLEREMELDRIRWKAVDELTFDAPFGLAKILAFAVQLQLAERWAGMDQEEGQQQMETLIQRNVARQARVLTDAGLDPSLFDVAEAESATEDQHEESGG